MAGIQNKEILNSLVSLFDMLDSKIKSVNESMVKLEKSIKDVNNAGSGADAKSLVENTKKLNEETAKLTELEKAQLKIKQQIEGANAKLIAAQSDEAKQLAKINEELRQQNTLNRLAAQGKTAEIGAYKKLSQELNNARNKYKDLAAAEKEGTKEAKDLIGQITKLDAKLKGIDANVGQFQRNVGNYTSAWGKFGATIKDFFIGGGILIAIQQVFTSLKNFGISSVDEANQAAKAWTKVDQAIKTTGGSAGYTTEQLKAMDDQLEALTNIDADQIMNDVSAQLLTFPKITGDEFERAQKAVLDLSTVLDKSDLKGTAIQVGKALQDPVKGITALNKAGVSFSASQKEVIKNLVATGKQAEAQRLILAELEKQYGGQAAAAAKTGLGGVEKFTIAWNNFKENIGAGLIPILNKVGEIAGNALSSLIEFFKTSTSYIVDFINGWIELYNESMLFRSVIETISIAFSVAWQSIKLFFNLATDGFTSLGKVIGYTFNPKNWGSGFSEGLSKIFTENFNTAKDDVFNYGKGVAESFKKGAQNVVKGKVSILDFSSTSTNNIKSVNAFTGDQKSIDKKLKDQLEKAAKIQANYDELTKIADKQALDDEQEINEAKLADYVETEKEIFDTGKYFRDLEDEAKLEELKKEEEYQNERKLLFKETAEFAGAMLGEMVANGTLSLKEFAKTATLIGLQVMENALTFAIAEIWFKNATSIAGIVKAGILTGLVKGVFAGLKSRVQKFAEGTEYVNGEGTETSDSINARLSKGERVVPSRINKLLMGIPNNRLPELVANGINTQKMESILEEVKYYNKMSSSYLANGSNTYVHDGFLIINDWKSGKTIKLPIKE